MSELAGPDQNPSPAADPMEQLYHLHDGVGVIGPIKGSKLREMIESGAVKRESNANLVGEPDWVPIMQFSPFSGYFGSEAVSAASAALPDTRAPREAAAREQGKFASFWIRLGAYVIDYVMTLGLVGIAAVIFAVVSVSVFGQAPTEEWLDDHRTVLNIVGTVIALTYYAYFTAGPWQATPGKRICGIYVIRTNGKRIDAPFAIFRDLAYVISSLPLFIGFLMALWTDEHKALHDIVCGTRVVYGKL